ncbi:MAG: glucose-6-phosphate isomerase family protein [Candidatus Nanohaloarchaea archaeon]|nr:glucose-6-phosphate isomerase family protein [Candidatus Nanohaloarchaea archaeon]
MAGGTLEFGAVEREPDTRQLDEMRSLLLDHDFAQEADNRVLYYMYRGLYREGDQGKIESHDLRYDITVIPPQHLGREYVKTKGHYHPDAGRGVSYPEIYEVISGEAHYLLQKKEGGEIVDVVVVEAEAGDKVVIPPGYGHITINPSKRKLKMANWVSSRFDSIYGDIEEKKGGAYYETVADEFVPNHNYDDLPRLRRVEAEEVPELGIERGRSMYSLIEAPDNLAFLNRPHKFMWMFEQLY